MKILEFTLVTPSSGQVIIKSILSPTDLERIFKNRYSISNVGKSSILIPFDKIQLERTSLIAVVISFISPPSIASIKIFSSFTRKGRYLIFFPFDGKVNS